MKVGPKRGQQNCPLLTLGPPQVLLQGRARRSQGLGDKRPGLRNSSHTVSLHLSFLMCNTERNTDTILTQLCGENLMTWDTRSPVMSVAA